MTHAPRILVRRAGEADLGWMLEQCRQFAAFFAQGSRQRSLFPADDAIALACLQNVLAAGVVFLAERGDERLGFLAGVVGQHPFNPAIVVLHELLWWVAPQHRGGSAGLRLLHAFEAYGHECGAEWTVMTIEDASPVNPGSLTRRGYVPKETSFLRETPTHLSPESHAVPVLALPVADALSVAAPVR